MFLRNLLRQLLDSASPVDAETALVTVPKSLLVDAVDAGYGADARFERCVAIVLKHEGGFVDHPRDPGGATKHGISLRYARTRGGMFDLDGDGDVDKNDILLVTEAFAAQVYRDWFWLDVRGDDLLAGVDLCLFDFAVNSGPGRAIRLAQRLAGTTVDGYIGPQTLSALRVNNVERFVHHYCDAREAWLRTLPTFDAFGRGWMNRVRDIRTNALQMAT